MINAKQVLNAWILSIRKYFFLYKDGFYEFPVLANSPQFIVDSLKGMPFITFFPNKNYYTSDTPFLKGSCHYEKLEDDLWLLVSDIEMKKNISFKMLYNNELPKKFHFLTLHVNKNKLSFKLPKINLDIENSDRSWTLFKAGSSAVNAHFKGQNSIFLSIYFSEEWLVNNVAQSGVFKNVILEHFFNSDKDCLFLPNFLEHKKEVYEPLLESIFDKDERGVKDFLMVKTRTLEVLSSFIKELEKQTTVKVFDNTSDSDRRKLFKAENILKESIHGKFPTIPSIAKQVGMSETKLKASFKKMFGVTLFQYFLTNQMKYAKDMMLKSDVSIKEVAITLGYANASKFSTSFKKVIGDLPSVYAKKIGDRHTS